MKGINGSINGNIPTLLLKVMLVQEQLVRRLPSLHVVEGSQMTANMTKVMELAAPWLFAYEATCFVSFASMPPFYLFKM
jgi:hypothetical protein